VTSPFLNIKINYLTFVVFILIVLFVKINEALSHVFAKHFVMLFFLLAPRFK